MRSQPPSPEPSNGAAVFALLREHFVMSLATVGLEGPHGAPLYYALDEAGRCAPALVFASDPAALHSRNLERDERVAATVHLETRALGELRGVQLRGRCRRAAGAEQARLRRIYLRAFPEAAALLALRPAMRLYRLEIEWAKLTDNRRGFGFKECYP